MLLPLFGYCFVSVLFCYALLSALSSFPIVLRDFCFTLIVFLISCNYLIVFCFFIIKLNPEKELNRLFITGSETDVAEVYLPEDQTSREMTTHIYSFSPFVSDGYPFHYTQGMLWTWDILFLMHEYANLIFTNISFNIYQVNTFNLHLQIYYIIY